MVVRPEGPYTSQADVNPFVMREMGRSPMAARLALKESQVTIAAVGSPTVARASQASHGARRRAPYVGCAGANGFLKVAFPPLHDNPGRVSAAGSAMRHRPSVQPEVWA